MHRHKFYSLDFVFFVVCLFLIAWMLISFYVEKNTDDSYFFTKKIRAGYEIRDYTEGVLIGSKINSIDFLGSFDIAKTKNALKDRGIEVTERPFFIRENKIGEKFVFFKIKNSSTAENTEGFLLALPIRNTAYNEFSWYITEDRVQKVYNDLVAKLKQDDISYDSNETWIEVRNPWYTIPFMRHNGVFLRIKQNTD